MNHSKKYILAIDLGPSRPKVALVSTYGKILTSELEETKRLRCMVSTLLKKYMDLLYRI